MYPVKMASVVNGHTGPEVQRIVLTGFMGAGKTTVGRLLGTLLDWPFLDADAVLCERAQATIAELFATHGEAHFRALEAATIADLAARDSLVLALGGGALEHAETLRLLTETPGTLLVYLETPLELSVSRCLAEPDAAVRPVLNDSPALQQRFEAREPLYRRAHLTIPTAVATPGEVAGQIASAARSAVCAPRFSTPNS